MDCSHCCSFCGAGSCHSRWGGDTCFLCYSHMLVADLWLPKLLSVAYRSQAAMQGHVALLSRLLELHTHTLVPLEAIDSPSPRPVCL